MAAYKSQQEPQIATPIEMGRAMAQHRAQNPIALATTTANAMYDALRTAAETQDGNQYAAAMTTVWDGVGQMQQIAIRQHQGFENSYALAMSLAAELDSLIVQLTSADDTMRGEAVQQFADRIEREVKDEALGMMYENAANAMATGDTWDVSEEDAKVFIIFLLTGQLEASTFRVLGQMLPQLQDRMNAIGAAQK